MRLNLKPFLLLLLTLCSLEVNGQWAFYNQETPNSLAPRLFAPYLISTPYNERDFAISPDGTELYFTLQYTATRSIIVYTRYTNGYWSLIKPVPFSSGQADLEPALSADGNTLFFASNRSLTGTANDFDIWFVDRPQGGSWGEPKLAGGGINSPGNEFYPSIAKNGNLYFTSERGGGKGGEDIWMSSFVNGQYNTPESLPVAINSIRGEYNAFIDPDEQFIYFSSDGRSDAIGGGDLYISRKGANGTWLPAGRLNFNSAQLDYCPYVASNGNYLFFTSTRPVEIASNGNPLDLVDVLHQVLSPNNNQGNLYWAKR